MPSPFAKLTHRRSHLDVDNPLRSLTDVINNVPEGINLGQGICDMETPSPLRREAVASISEGVGQTYTNYAGLPELRSQIAAKLRKFNHLDYEENQVMVATGSSGAQYAGLLTLVEPGDEVILFEPFYPYHISAVKLVGAVPVCVQLQGAEFDFDPDRLRAAITPRTRAIILNSPGNPTGKMFGREDLEAVAEVLKGTDVLVFTDEVYEYMCFDGREHISPATVAGLEDRTLTIGSFSKTYSITGWRIGYLAGPPDIVEMVGRVFDQIDICAPRPLQRGVARGLEELPASFYTEMQSTYQDKRDRFCAALVEAGFRFAIPQGAYYVLADYSDVLGDLEPYPAVLSLIERVGINAVPGYLFYADPKGVQNLRFQFAVDMDVIDEACKRLAGMESS
jgi:aminotransferase